MSCRMEVYIDGGCRSNGQDWAIGAAAACFKSQGGEWDQSWIMELPRGRYERKPTSQRAELSAVIMALNKIIEKANTLPTNAWPEVTIYTDSKYVVGCMRDWIVNWQQNNFRNANGKEVANRDLIEEASDLDYDVLEMGSIAYVWIPREQNTFADRMCNVCLDRQERRITQRH
ncbi:ribonuclease H1 [Venturia nashicola]|uniref:ribonuclease H n=1 Tax=Venturia nashicola TaxID=86259 RepID=A0A4Z1P3S4_9PEZI|nr:ribonuclease H1 [Venturia nashicola]